LKTPDEKSSGVFVF